MSRVSLLTLVFCVVVCASVFGQASGTIQIEVKHEGKPVTDATVVVNGITVMTDADGLASVTLSPGTFDITAVKKGFVTVTSTAMLAPGQTQHIAVDLQVQPSVEETITVSATRTDARLEDQPMRVEVLAREEIEEKLLMTPGDIVMMLNEMGGTRVQATSPSLGAASVRIQGLRGRYTRFFSDGLPLDRKSTRLNSSHVSESRMPSSA